MTVSARKAIFGIVLSLILVGVAAPTAYWYAAAAIDHAFGFQPIGDSQILLILAAFSFLVGVFWASWAYTYLFFVGKGLPLEAFGTALHATEVLVTTGPYAYTRNPMLIGLLFLLLGVGLLQRSISGLAMLPIVVAIMIPYLKIFEEKALSKRFGQDYDVYRSNVPLLIPRLTPYIHEL
ncbi:MAG: isoprenylcysteine carboxylmethyltransferase family protein [Armatimonadota bacterium]|nr:isoprenylcysteine carboxylmethyltransferase family protein [bacterium]